MSDPTTTTTTTTTRQGGHQHPMMGRHGMLLVGRDPIFASHLPMFHPPHDFQSVIEVGFDDPATEAYRRDRDDSGEAVYTLRPESFSWDELLPDGGDPPERTSFRADVFRGHFERGGDRIITAATVEVRQVTYFSRLSTSTPPGDDLTYRAIGRGDDLYLAHEITGAPNFDHVLFYRFADPAFSEMEMTGAPVVILDRPDSIDARLQPQEQVTAHFPQTIGPEGQHGFTTELAVLDEVYLEIDELKG